MESFYSISQIGKSLGNKNYICMQDIQSCMVTNWRREFFPSLTGENYLSIWLRLRTSPAICGNLLKSSSTSTIPKEITEEVISCFHNSLKDLLGTCNILQNKRYPQWPLNRKYLLFCWVVPVCSVGRLFSCLHTTKKQEKNAENWKEIRKSQGNKLILIEERKRKERKTIVCLSALVADVLEPPFFYCSVLFLIQPP